MVTASMRFEDLLDNAITAILEQGKTTEDCLALYPDQREELEPLLRLVVRLEPARTLQAPPEFRRTAAARMRTLIAGRPRRAAPTVSQPRPRRDGQWKLGHIIGIRRLSPATLIVSVVLAVLLLTGAGTVYAANDALPGDALYGLKAGIERFQLQVSLNDAHDAELHLKFAARRLEEAQALLAAGRIEDFEQALGTYEIQIQSAQVYLDQDTTLSTAEQTGLAQSVLQKLPRYQEELKTLASQAPQAIQPDVGSALTLSAAVVDLAQEVASEAPGLVTPSLLPTATRTPRPTPSPTLPPPTLTPSPKPPTLTPSAEPTAWATPAGWPTTSTWPITSEWPITSVWPLTTGWPLTIQWPLTAGWPITSGWPLSPDWPIPPEWPIPSEWLTPSAWPTPPAWPIPTEVPSLPSEPPSEPPEIPSWPPDVPSWPPEVPSGENPPQLPDLPKPPSFPSWP